MKSALTTTSSEIKYLMLDHGGILDGSVSMELPSDQDLLLYEICNGVYQILRKGVQIINQLNILVNEHGYQIVFHSKNKQAEQLDLLQKLQVASLQKGIEFPHVKAMAVRDPELYTEVSAERPSIMELEGIMIAGYGVDEQDGKACVRQALSSLLDIKPIDRVKHIVIDDGPTIILKAKEEGWTGYQVNEEISLSDIIEYIYQHEVSKKIKIAFAKNKGPTF